MNKYERWEMAICAVLGNGIALALGQDYELTWWIMIPLSALISCGFYRPMELHHMCMLAITRVTESIKKVQWVRCVVGWTFTGIKIVIGAIVTCASMMIIPLGIMMYWSLLDELKPTERPFGYSMGSFLFGAFAFLLMLPCSQIYNEIQKLKERIWIFPFTRRLRWSFPIVASAWYVINGEPQKTTLSHLTWRILICQGLGVILVFWLVIDAALTIMMALATTRRGAVVSSSMIGCATGLALGGWDAFLVSGSIAGVCGYFWYPIAEKLRAPVTWAQVT